MAGLVQTASEHMDSLMLDAANAYAGVYADVIYSAPVCHSGQDILDESVPFYTLVFSGLAECVAPFSTIQMWEIRRCCMPFPPGAEFAIR